MNEPPDQLHDHDHEHDHDRVHVPATRPTPQRLALYSPSGALRSAALLRRAAARLGRLGFAVETDVDAVARLQRFAGTDESRLAAIHRVADARPDISMPTRGGYGLSRLLDGVEWKRIARSVDSGTRWVGHSDFTAFQLALLAHRGGVTWAGPLATDDFGRSDADGGVDDVTAACFVEAMGDQLEAVGFRTGIGFDGLDVRGTLWGGNLCMVNSLLGTPHWPKVKGGVLFLEDVNEHPYRIERNLLQLHQAGVLDAQKAIVLGQFTAWRKSPLDRGYALPTMVERIRQATRTPVLTGLPFGHVETLVTMPVGRTVQLVVEKRDVYVAW